MNQVEFLGLVHTLANLAVYAKLLKKGMDTRVEIKGFAVVREVNVISQPHWSLPRFGFV